MNSIRRKPSAKVVIFIMILLVLTVPIIAQEAANQSISVERMEQVKAEAEAMCAEVNAFGYGIGGFMCGIIGWIIAASSTAEPPAEALLQYNAAEQQVFIDAYEKCVKKKRRSAACSGWLAGVVLVFLLSGTAQ